MKFLAIKMVTSGDRVKLVKTNDPYTSLQPGALGTVDSVDKVNMDGGFTQVWVKWDDGGLLALIPEAGDEFEIVTGETIEDDNTALFTSGFPETTTPHDYNAEPTTVCPECGEHFGLEQDKWSHMNNVHHYFDGDESVMGIPDSPAEDTGMDFYEAGTSSGGLGPDGRTWVKDQSDVKATGHDKYIDMAQADYDDDSYQLDNQAYQDYFDKSGLRESYDPNDQEKWYYEVTLITQDGTVEDGNGYSYGSEDRQQAEQEVVQEWLDMGYKEARIKYMNPRKGNSQIEDIPDEQGGYGRSGFTTEGAHGSGRKAHEPWMSPISNGIKKETDEELTTNNIMNRAQEILDEYQMETNNFYKSVFRI
jgi:hypothetical protein